MAELEPLAELLTGRRLAVLTGAGCSTESGIPDYRGPETSRRARNPVRFQEFVGEPAARRRYWARAAVGWTRFADKRPNAAHRALAALEEAGVVQGVITQNVDRLHQDAGSRRVVELHGSLHRVRCLGCQDLSCRHALQRRLLAANPGFDAHRAEMAPDGDADLADAALTAFTVVDCARCGGPLKPDVVFFGEGVPRATVEDAFALLEDAEALLVVGTSLAVYSGLRFVRRASRLGLPVALVNLGRPERGYEAVHVHVDAPAGDALSWLATSWIRSSSV